MAMLGKRFQRTISMSQIGPGSSNLHTEKAQAHPSSTGADPPTPKLPLILHDSNPQKTNEQLLMQAAATQWEALKARQQDDQHILHHNHHPHHQHHHLHGGHHETPASNPWEALMKGFGGSGPQQGDLNTSKHQPAPAHRSEILKNAEAMMAMMMQQRSCHESSVQSSVEGAEEYITQVMASSPVDSHLHLGLWPRFPANANSSPSSISRAHFLDACFLCKRRLRHERDIFIYRGDTAFCSEECRQRQILSDETLSLRASRKGGGILATTP